MTRFALFLPIALLLALLHHPSSVAAAKPADAPTLESVLKKMDSVAANFHTTQAEFEWDIYQKVIDEVDDVETGTIYYRHNGKDVEMMAQVKQAGSSKSSLKPEPKFVLLSGGKVRLYQPKLDQVTEIDLGKNQSDYQSYLVLGFGGSGQDLQKTFDVTFVGPETVAGVSTAKLQLIPKSEKVKNTYNQIFLWIDLDRGISVKQQFFQPQGDYRLATYSDIQVNGKKIADDVFKLKTTSKTQTVSPKS
jgi:outer membrane lipoprotein-sorting protein